MARTALSLVESGEDFAWATIIESQGSAPRHADTSMLIRSRRETAGTIGGGPLEAAVIEDAVHVLRSRGARLMRFDSAELGMACGGGGLVLIEYVDPAEPATLELYPALADLLASGRRGWLVSAIREGEGGQVTVNKCLVDTEGSIHGPPVGSSRDLQELGRSGGALALRATDEATMIYVQPVGVRGTAYVFGAGHCGEKLVPVLSASGFFTVVIDDRADFANQERFPTADRIMVPDTFEEAMAELPVDEDGYIVILTRGHLHDKNVLRQALETKAGYVGMMGSRRKVAEIFASLHDEGVSLETLARVHAPIGLSIGAETPEEIAVSIAAELIQVRANRGT